MKKNDSATTGCSFIDKVTLYCFYCKGNDTVKYPGLTMNDRSEIKYFSNLVLRKDLISNGYSLFYKITATDKAIFPHTTFYPEDGYKKLNFTAYSDLQFYPTKNW